MASSISLYEVTQDETTGYIYMDTLMTIEHEYTLIFLHGLGSYSNDYSDRFANQGIMPKNFRIVLP